MRKNLEKKLLIGISVVTVATLAGISFLAYDNQRIQNEMELRKAEQKAEQDRKELTKRREKEAAENNRKEQILIDNTILKKAANMCQSTFSTRLKSSSSYRNEVAPWARFSGDTYEKSKISVLLIYSATNSYGGRLDGTTICQFYQEGENNYVLYEVNGTKPLGLDSNKELYTVTL